MIIQPPTGKEYPQPASNRARFGHVSVALPPPERQDVALNRTAEQETRLQRGELAVGNALTSTSQAAAGGKQNTDCREQCGKAAAPKSQPTLSSAQSQSERTKLSAATDN